MTEERITFNAIESPFDERDWSAEQVLVAADYTPPATFDLRPRLNPVVNQGRLGSCVSQASACMREFQEGFDNRYMSTRFVYNLREDTNTEGMYVRNAMKTMQNMGICTDQTFPYYETGTPHAEAIKEASSFKIQSYARLNTIKGTKLALSTNGPVMATYDVYNTGRTFWKPEQAEDKVIGGHAVALVGYNTEGFILRNSWGRRWGDGGYVTWPYSEFDRCLELWTTVDSLAPHPYLVDNGRDRWPLYLTGLIASAIFLMYI